MGYSFLFQIESFDNSFNRESLNNKRFNKNKITSRAEMIFPTKKEYIEKAENYNLIPVFKEFMVDTETPVSIFIKAGGLETKSFLLESIEGSKNIARYSFIGVGYNSIINFSEGNLIFESKNNKTVNIKTNAPLTEIQNILNSFCFYKNPELEHFTGGVVGYLSYDLVRYFENIPLPPKYVHFPEIALFLTDLIIVFDHILNRMKIISTVKISEDLSPEKAYFLSVKKIKEVEEKIYKCQIANCNNSNFKNSNYNNFYSPNINLKHTNFKNSKEKLNIKSNFKKEKFIESVERIKNYIIDGDVFQVVLSQRFFTSYSSNPFNIYRALRTVNPSPYMYYINFGDFKIIGSSPEPLIKINNRKVLTYPIAGTRKRGINEKEDRFLINNLLNDEKEKAEHNMLVDLARNDLGRVCRFGSVKITKYMYVEKYSHVIHLVSRIEGILDKNKTIYDALKSAFPAGTLTGAPKVRAMQIISELEPDRRGPYGGVVGYIGYDGNLDTCITIRTAIVKDNLVYIQSGAGIVYDSIPENECDETINKASALFKSIELIK